MLFVGFPLLTLCYYYSTFAQIFMVYGILHLLIHILFIRDIDARECLLTFCRVFELAVEDGRVTSSDSVVGDEWSLIKCKGIILSHSGKPTCFQSALPVLCDELLIDIAMFLLQNEKMLVMLSICKNMHHEYTNQCSLVGICMVW